MNRLRFQPGNFNPQYESCGGKSELRGQLRSENGPGPCWNGSYLNMERLVTSLTEDRKFAIIAVGNIATTINEKPISDGDSTIVSHTLPFQIEEHWRDWLGRIQINNLAGCNLFIERFSTSGWAADQLEILDAGNERLKNEVEELFSLLHLLWTWEYERSHVYLLTGYVKGGVPSVRQFNRLEPFRITRGYTRVELKEQDVLEGLRLHRAALDLRSRFRDGERVRVRFWRGFRALMDALKRNYSSDRLHGLVRSLEALILPEKSNTERQFIERCGIMAAPERNEKKAQQMLGEAYRLRSDVEHVHEWYRSLAVAGISVDEQENRALWRTRQIEALSCAAYRRILLDVNVQEHFMTDSDLREFWSPSNVANARKAMGNICDITKIPVVNSYHACGRAQ
jgi:hypothetical protein